VEVVWDALIEYSSNPAQSNIPGTIFFVFFALGTLPAVREPSSLERNTTTFVLFDEPQQDPIITLPCTGKVIAMHILDKVILLIVAGIIDLRRYILLIVLRINEDPLIMQQRSMTIQVVVGVVHLFGKGGKCHTYRLEITIQSDL
jgi:hypothetical protein